MSQLKIIRDKAAGLKKRVLLPEAATDIRVILAGIRLYTENLAIPVFLGSESAIHKLAEDNNTSIPAAITILPVADNKTEPDKISYFREKLSHKNPTDEQIRAMSSSALFTAGWLLDRGDADAAVAGSVASTPDVIRAALRTVGVAEGSSIVSSSFLMEMPDGNVFTYADCAVVPYPNSAQLASIALDAGNTHQKLTGSEPVIAFLSFSTKGSAMHESVDLVQEAFNNASVKNKGWLMDGELQFDTAFVSDIARRKAPESPVGGKANVFIFPNLDAGNIAYKITERLAGALATGPILQGLGKPYMDLSRGCSVDDIVNTACVGALLSV
ncbi:MAG: phosphotransacetylase [Balneolaceae bacterium]|nr:MAG: phosphotransacetylase [Balneolaceae bacterium]